MSRDTFYLAENDLGTSIDVNYTLREKVTDGTFLATIGERETWATIYPDVDDATAMVTTLSKVRNQRICNLISINLTDRSILFVEKGYKRFDRWNELKSPIWEYNNDNTEVISMGYAFVNVFNGIKDGLRALHDKGECHGNLLNGVTISGSYDVKLFNMRRKSGDIEKCISEDIDDFVTLVELVISSHPPANNLQLPASVELFKKLDLILKNITLHPAIKEDIIRFRAYFIVHNPIFAERDKRLKLIKKFVCLWEISEVVRNTLVLEDSLTSIDEWWFKINPSDEFLHGTLQFASTSYFNKKGAGKKSILGFFRDCFNHKHEQRNKNAIEDVAIEMALLKTFPDFLPKCYFEFVQKLAGTEFTNTRPSYIEYFKVAEPRIC